MKRMLEYKDGTFHINSSSVEIINTCRRKAQYSLHQGLRVEGASEALSFGTAIHAGLEAFYRSRDRKLDDVIEAFINSASQTPALSSVPAGEKRSIDNGIKILKRYFEIYENDPWVTYVDDKGPFVERSFEVPFLDHYIHGTIDAVLQNTETGEIVACDHKTATSLSDLAKRSNPNLQFSIYIWALQGLGLDVRRMMVNGIQVAKTKSDFVRIFTERNYTDFEEMFDSVITAMRDYDQCLTSGKWPMNTASCSNYGGCQYLEICSLNRNLRKTAIEGIYGVPQESSCI